MNNALDTQRIDHLINSSEAASKEITVVGLGSVGANVVQQLAMCGIRRWNLFDPDQLEPVNLVKHPAGRSQIGRQKVDITYDWLRDRNPDAHVRAFAEDARRSSAFNTALINADLVICAVDDPASRSWINAECVRLRRPCLTGSVIRTGLGGQIYLYIPEETGCLSCMQMAADANSLNFEDALDLTEEERHHRYGLGEENFTTSGLAIDIALVSSFQAHMAWSALLGGQSTYVPRLNFNWLTVGIRPEKGVFSSHYMTTRVLVRSQRVCVYKCGDLEDRRLSDEN